jgi:hypothetical protein
VSLNLIRRLIKGSALTAQEHDGNLDKLETAVLGKAAAGAIGSSGLTMATLRILGRTTTGAGAIETIEVIGATLANGVLTITGGGATDLDYVASTRTVTSSTGSDAVLTLADGVNAGLMSSADYLKLLSLTFGVLPVPVYNNTGATIAKGVPVYVTGSSGTRITIAPADASLEATAARTIGLTSAAITNNTEGTVIAVGELTGLNTSTLTEGQIIWLSETTGAMTTTRPTQPAHGVVLGYCVKQGAGTSGIVYVKVDNGLEIDELHDVLITSKATGQALMLAADGLWKNRSLVAADLSDSSASGRTVLTGTPAQGRSGLELGSAAQAATTDFATAAQGALASTAVQPATLAGYVQTSDARLSDAREWSAVTIDQAEAEAGTATTRRAFTAQRVFQAVAAWWSGYSSTVGKALATAVDAAAGRTAISAAASGAIGSSGLTMATARLLGRTTASTGAPEEITVVGATLSGGVLTITGGTASPGGTSGQVQFNNAGALGGAAGLTIDGSGNIDVGVVSGRLRLPVSVSASPQTGDVYLSSGSLRFRDGNNVEQQPELTPDVYAVGNWITPQVGTVATGGGMTANTIYLAPLRILRACTIGDLGVSVSTAVAGSSLQLALYARGADGAPAGLPITSTGSISAGTATSVSGNASATLAPGLYWAGINSTAAIAVGTISPSSYGGSIVGLSGLADVLSARTGRILSFTFGTWPDLTANPTGIIPSGVGNRIPFVAMRITALP